LALAVVTNIAYPRHGQFHCLGRMESEETVNIVKKNEPTAGLTLNKGKLRSQTQSPFQQRINQAKAEQVDPSTMPHRICLMLDCSGSMNTEESTPNGYNKRIDLLKIAIDAFTARCNPNDTSLAAETFPEGMSLELTSNMIRANMFASALHANNGTPMHKCIVKCLSAVPMTRGVLVSDGQADNWPDWADIPFVGDSSEGPVKLPGDASILTKYKNQGIPIDCVHISQATQGEDLLRRIARETGGIFIKFTDVSIFSTAFAYLTPGFRAMLTDGRITAEQMGAKELIK
jgi:hypothetical protein